jgi:FlaA1/EpsC-like NDP-sugar epimerase
MMQKLAHRCRRLCGVALHLVLAVLANALAFALRFDFDVPSWAVATQVALLPWLVGIRGVVFLLFGVFHGVWRYAGMQDLRNIVASVTVSSTVFAVVASVAAVGAQYPRSVLVIDAVLLICFCGGLRLAVRTWREGPPLSLRPGQPTRRKVLIFGAGQAGAMIGRDIRNNAYYHYEPVGYIDDDLFKVGRSIHGIPVLGTRRDLPRVMAERAPDEVLIAMPAADAATVRGVLRDLERFQVQITVLPNLRDLLDGTVTVNQIRKLSIEDLLPRAPVGLDDAPLRDLLAGRRVLVTGAGGSIGTELCLQIAAFKPDALVLFERTENSLYAITNLLADRGLALGVHPVLGDVTDALRLESVFAHHRPEIVFHAAAHKHVPLMEANPCEAVKNNVTGTRLVAEAAARHGSGRFVLISTDKAVNPSSIMGVTKRVAELIVADQDDAQSTAFLTVRFGNVLGSNGSVVPRFLDQIKAGGPVTITHPEVRRFFMLLPEAVQLVLHVAWQGRASGTYVLDMGDQIKVADMARNLIRLSGLAPDEDIKLSYVGLRPGEKLYEELIGMRETVQPSSIQKVFEVVSGEARPTTCFRAELRRLERFAKAGDTTKVVTSLRHLVPEFTGRPWELAPEAVGKLRTRAAAVSLLTTPQDFPADAVLTS